ncbi:MAG: exodeoxyribonuclease VII large subunit [Bacteroidota bacterium]
MPRRRTPQGPSLFSPSPPSPAPDAAADAVPVGVLVGQLKATVEATCTDVWVEGELSNVSRPASGHLYFTLKDTDAQIRCAMWRHFAERVGVPPRDGMQVRVRASASVYERRGDLQLIVRRLQPAGEGALRRAFEALKQRLEAEGLFDEGHKQPLPVYPETIGLATSGTGAALHDMLTVLGRRFPHVRVLVCPVRVQGVGAAEEIAEAIEAFGAVPPGDPLRVDVLIVGRGGGSAEDLWAFNEEVVARAVHACPIPVVSAVGHETDTSISDLVADRRAATPSMAAELVVPDRREVAAYVQGLQATLHAALSEAVTTRRQRVRQITASYAFNRPLDQLRQTGQHLDELIRRLDRAVDTNVAHRQQQVEHLRQQLALLDPRRPLAQGYVRVEREGRPIVHAEALRPDDVVMLRFGDGVRTARIVPDAEPPSS